MFDWLWRIFKIKIPPTHSHTWINPLDNPYNIYCTECGERRHSYSVGYCGQGDYWDNVIWEKEFYEIDEKEFQKWLDEFHTKTINCAEDLQDDPDGEN